MVLMSPRSAKRGCGFWLVRSEGRTSEVQLLTALPFRRSPPPLPTLFPSPTLFRSVVDDVDFCVEAGDGFDESAVCEAEECSLVGLAEFVDVGDDVEGDEASEPPVEI